MSDKVSSQILDRGLEILETVVRRKDEVSVEELSTDLGIHRSTAYRYISCLLARGYIQKTQFGTYRSGPKILELAGRSLEKNDLRSLARPLLHALCERVGKTVHLSTLCGDEIVYLDKVESPRSLPIYSRLGGRAPVHCTGLGKVLLAFSPPERQERSLAALEFPRYTAATISTAEDLREELASIRRTGYALDRGEHEEGIHCVAVPVFDFFGEAVAAISVTDLARGFTGQVRRLVQELQQTAQEISRGMGGRPRRGAEEMSL